MSEADYQMALLLQHQFEQELRPIPSNRDEDYARQLQEQFQREQNVDNPSNGLSYQNSKAKKILNSSKSLTDPSWELVDPTPDIHMLFVAFNERFFWNKLLMVSVSWSKRMTSCAGICSYNGYGGVCKITLSEPLLKLRPRKDLVETLLHEMIHAYLFVTHNNRDRDGHGPEFHKHMWRINKETGTNITVYHSFHDEVRLYQQHWWRCNGPCQNRKPFFGMVKRATNRAPGPYDRWWAEHAQTCGGTFIKVKEPEKAEKKTKEKKQEKRKGEDIRKFMPIANNLANNVKGLEDLNKNKITKEHSYANSTIEATKTPTKTDESFSEATVSTLNKNSPTTSHVSNANDLYSKLPKNVKGFNDLNSSTTDYKPMIFNNSTPKKTDLPKVHETTKDFLETRNHWQNKFKNESKKRQSSDNDDLALVPAKIPKLNCANCPVCDKNIPTEEINVHLDLCLFTNSMTDDEDIEEVKNCPICDKAVGVSEYDRHAEQCIIKMIEGLEKEFGEIDEEDKENFSNKEEKTKCLACDKEINKMELDSHLEECLNVSSVFEKQLSSDRSEDRSKDDDIEENDEVTCPICFQVLKESEIRKHVDLCLNSSTENIFGNDDNEDDF